MSRPTTLLINPPLWNAYAPHLAVPLLAAAMRLRGWPVVTRDLCIEALNDLISADGLTALEPRLRQRAGQDLPDDERRAVARALTLLPSTVEHIHGAKKILRSAESLSHHDDFLRSQLVQRNALRCVSAAFPGLTFDLISNDLYYSARSTASVLRATEDPERNVYAWALDRILPPVLADPSIGLVAVSVSADTQLIAAMTIARMVKAARPDVTVVFGGNYITRVAVRWARPHRIFDVVDHLLLYEGEDALPALCEALFEDRSWDRVPGLVSVRDGGLVRTHSHDVDVTESPVPDYGGYPLHEYFAPGPILPIFASRSCAWSCSFCSIPFASNRFRMRDPQRVVDEMDALASRHGARHFMFVDEIMTIRTLRGVAEELVHRGRDYSWYGETRFANGLTAELARTLRASGCRRLNFGLESYNERVLKLMRKEVKLEWVERNIDSLLAAGVPIHLFAILGFPTETAEEAHRTVEFAQHILQRYRDAGIPWSTWGASPFILDLHSPVARDPDSFGVQVIPPPREEDLALSASYRVRSGMAETAAQALGATLGGKPSAAQDPLWFHRDHRKDVEEFTFLRAAHEVGFPGQLGRPAYQLPPGWQDRATALGADTTLTWSPVPVTSTGPATSTGPVASEGPVVSEGPCAVFYRADTDFVLEVPCRDAEALRSWPKRTTAGRRAAWLAEHAGTSGADAGTDAGAARRVVADLLRFGFLVATPELPAVAVDRNWAELRFTAEHRVLDRTEGDGTTLLSSTVTGKSLRLNTTAELLWRLCAQPGGCTGEQLGAEVPASGPEVLGGVLHT